MEEQGDQLVLRLMDDQRRRWLSGQPRKVEEYLAEHRALSDGEEALLDFIYGEVCLREELGETVAAGEYQDRFPQLRTSLARLFEIHGRLGANGGQRTAAARGSALAVQLAVAEPLSTADLRHSIQDSSHNPLAPAEPVPAAKLSRPNDCPAQIGRYRVEAVLGSGAFGKVYRCYDGVLKRSVAVKVPHRHHLDTPELYLEEARVLASLEHPAIVPVHDAGRTEDGVCYVVSKFIEGSNLKTRSREAPLSRLEAVELVATMAEALHYAHMHGVVHRDLKPANIIIDLQLRPYLADFGLALRDEDFGEHGQGAGTPLYMSPEQARCEGHLVDGRSDIFSLGVVFYELLTATRPFRGSNTEEILERIRMLEPRPPRQIDDTIPKELERICLKALSKRASDRYNIALDMTEDLRAFLGGFHEVETVSLSSSRGTAAPHSVHAVEILTVSSAGIDTDKPVKIVPKGLRSFDQTDADFFLKLLPGPHDRHGIPESVRFWKTRIEETDPEKSFRVGIIYGPSGCGKSSLIKAGLLPLLDPSVIKVYVEASGADTEQRLLRNLRRQLTGLPDSPGSNEQLGLVRVLAALRRGPCLAEGDKVLLVLDQFEQWLHAHGGEKDAELVQALRQCDGIRVQCLVMVRDDFWLAASRFMQALEVRVVEGENSRLVDLFDTRHARKVLAALGHAFGALPETDRGKEQDEFLDQAVAALAQDGKVVSVRLSLFAEMVKSKPWTPAALRAIGGAEGVGVTFLEETFSSPTAPPHHRLHQKAAQSVLSALLPEAGSDIKGHMRSREELLEASGCRNDPRQFDEIIAMLDGELRLVTPSDSEILDGEGGCPLPAAARDKNYQLTHDYLVPSLRTWLMRKQNATRQGRAALHLAELASLWTARPESRRLPSLFEFLQICLSTKRRAWNDRQRKMMAAAARYHALRGVATMLVFALIVIGAYEYRARFKAIDLHDQLFRAQIDKVPLIVDELASYRRWADPLLRQDDDEAISAGDGKRRLRASLALLPSDESQVAYLYNRLIDAEPEEIDVIRRALQGHQDRIVENLWGVFKSPQNEHQYLCAASALALYAPDDPRWDAASPQLAAILARVSQFFVKYWTDALRNVQVKLVGPLSGIARDPARIATERLSATNILTACAPRRGDLLTPVLIDGNEEQFAAVFPFLPGLGHVPVDLLETELGRPAGDGPADPQDDRIAQRKARAAIALLRLFKPENVWPLFKRTPDERVRSYLIHWSAPLGVDPRMVVQHWTEETDAGIRSALLLLLGEFPAADNGRPRLLEQLLAIFENEADPGLHGAAQWLLRKWKFDKDLQAAIDRFARNEAQRRADRATRQRGWYVNRERETFVIVRPQRPFIMGSPESEPGRENNENQHPRQIGQPYAIAACPVTIEQFQHFLAQRPKVVRMAMLSIARTGDSPQTGMNWYEAADYCNWLSEKDGISPDQWCYQPNEQNNFAEGMRARDKYLALTGYRLPTEAEWEFACRAGTTTQRYFAQSEALLPDYAWYVGNSADRTWPVATLKPNDLGLFDMLGNVWQWCESPPQGYPPQSLAAVEDKGITVKITDHMKAALRGGSFENLPRRVRAAYRGSEDTNGRQKFLGFRPVRTLPADPSRS